MDGSKKCCACKWTLPFDSFREDLRTKDRLSLRCSVCDQVSYGPKACTSCKVVLPLTSFHKESRSRDGHRSKCSSCISTQAKLDSEKAPIVDSSVTHMPCARCKRLGRDWMLPVGDFGVARRRRNGKNSWCKQCCSETTCAWQKTEEGRRRHIEAVKRYNKRKRLGLVASAF